MAAPCRKCGSQRTSSIEGWRNLVGRAFGYRVKLCVGCRRIRWIRNRSRVRSSEGESFEFAGWDELAVPMAPPPRTAPTAPARDFKPANAALTDTEAESGYRRVLSCPYCGGNRLQRSRRRFFERLRRKGKMMRCHMCWRRFPESRAILRDIAS